MSGRSYVGSIYAGVFSNAGIFTGFIDHRINATTLSFTAPEVETVSRISKRREDAGQTLDEFQETTGTPTMSMTTNSAIPEIMAMILLGDKIAVDVSAGSAAAESVTFYHDKWVQLANINVEDGTVSIDDGASGTFTEGTDYEVNERLGMIKALSTGTMDDATAYDTSYDYTAITGYKVVGHTKQNVRVKLFGDMEDQNTKKRGELLVHDARLRPSDAIGFIQDQAFLEGTLEGSLVTPAGEDGPFHFREIEAA